MQTVTFSLFLNKTAPVSSMSMIWSSKSVLPSQNFDTHLFHVLRKSGCSWFSWLVMIFILLGPRPLGPMGPSMFCDFSKIQFMVWDLSKSVPKVFRSPRNPLIHLFYLIFNQNATFQNVIRLLNCLLYCLLYFLLNCLFPVELPIESPIDCDVERLSDMQTDGFPALPPLPTGPRGAAWRVVVRENLRVVLPRKPIGRNYVKLYEIMWKNNNTNMYKMVILTCTENV